jgi:uncharacterized protein (DUF58 family)
MDARCLVYPRPAEPGRPLPDGTAGGVQGKLRAGDDDFAGLRSASPGDPLQRIAWKAYARNDLLLLKEFSSGTGEPCVLDWQALPELDVEQRLAQLARWCLDADFAGRSLALRLPGRSIPLGHGPKHLAACLEALALFDAGTQPRGADTPGPAGTPAVGRRAEPPPRAAAAGPR